MQNFGAPAPQMGGRACYNCRFFFTPSLECAALRNWLDVCQQQCAQLPLEASTRHFTVTRLTLFHYRRRCYPPGPRLPHQGQPHLLQLRRPGPSLSRVHQPPEGEVLLRMWRDWTYLARVPQGWCSPWWCRYGRWSGVLQVRPGQFSAKQPQIQ